MDTWAELESWVRATYTKVAVGNIGPESLKILLDTGDGRTQVVQVRPITSDEGEWVDVFTPVAEERDFAARDALLQNAKLAVGGFALTGPGMLIFRFTLPLHRLDPTNLEVAIRLVG